jgi:acetyl esterase/lipase
MRILAFLLVAGAAGWSLWAFGDASKGVNRPDVVYSSPNGTELLLDFVRPEGDGPFPLILCIHGGGWRQGSRTDYREFQQKMSELGMASASIQYRLTPKHQFPAQIDDVQAAIKYLVEHKADYKIDPQRIATFGGSAGGHLALLSGLSLSDPSFKVVAIVNVCGPTDLRTFRSSPSGDKVLKNGVSRDSSELLEDLLGTANREDKVYATASPITFVNQNGPAVLTAHGTADDLVPLEQAEKLHAALKNVRADERLIVIKNGGHDLGKWPDPARTNALVDIVAFFQKHLKP